MQRQAGQQSRRPAPPLHAAHQRQLCRAARPRPQRQQCRQRAAGRISAVSTAATRRRVQSGSVCPGGAAARPLPAPRRRADTGCPAWRPHARDPARPSRRSVIRRIGTGVVEGAEGACVGNIRRHEPQRRPSVRRGVTARQLDQIGRNFHPEAGNPRHAGGQTQQRSAGAAAGLEHAIPAAGRDRCSKQNRFNPAAESPAGLRIPHPSAEQAAFGGFHPFSVPAGWPTRSSGRRGRARRSKARSR